MNRATPLPTPATSDMERPLVLVVIGALAAFAAWFDATALSWAFTQGIVAVGRGGAAVALGWIAGWYLTCRFEPTHSLLVHGFLTLAGYVVAAVTAAGAFSALALIDLLGADPERSPYLAITAVTFAPVASWFATRLDDTRSVHVVAGLGMGGFGYLVLLGVPD